MQITVTAAISMMWRAMLTRRGVSGTIQRQPFIYRMINAWIPSLGLELRSLILILDTSNLVPIDDQYSETGNALVTLGVKAWYWQYDSVWQEHFLWVSNSSSMQSLEPCKYLSQNYVRIIWTNIVIKMTFCIVCNWYHRIGVNVYSCWCLNL